MPTPSRRLLPWALVAALAAVGCGPSTSPPATSTDAGDDLGLPADTPTPDTPSSTDISPDVPPAQDIPPALDAPLDAPTDAPSFRCAADLDCRNSELGTLCDTASGRCVPCTLAQRGSCAPTEYCTAALRCETGCGADSDCAASTATPRCDTAAHRCVACVTDAHCPGAANAAGRCAEARCTVGCNEGFADCDSDPSNGCEVDTRTSPAHCGSCGLLCPAAPNAAPACAAGRCGSACNAGFADCDNDPSNGCEVDTRTSPTHCGRCANACPTAPNSLPGCAMGACRLACSEGFADCDGLAPNGCEASLRGTANCGACGTSCSGSTPLCADDRGAFVCSSGCATGQTRCGSTCADTATSPAHCGACDNACPSRPNARPACAGGTCALSCEAGFGNCDGNAANGCEAAVSSDPRHCGTCGNLCPGGANARATCEGSRCGLRCDPGFEDCDGDPSNGCEVDLQRSGTHCGRCGNACPAGPGSAATCTAGRCGLRCDANRGDCDGDPSNGCEVDLRSATSHCGRCANVCPAGSNATPTCAEGVCGATCAEGFADCDGLAGNGCEVSLRGTANCGRCGNTCGPSTPLCALSNGTLSCASGCADGEVRCGGSCVRTATSLEHCGGCDMACPARPNASRTCAAGACGITCSAGFGDCDTNSANGCEADTRTSTQHCGGCGTVCPARPNADPTCTAGACGIACTPGFANCDGNASNGCEANTRTSPQHCGACGTVCPSGRCEEGRCVNNRSCADILRALPSSASGNYTIDPDGAGGRSPYTVYCDMTTDGGGWTLIFQPITSNYNDGNLDYTIQDAELLRLSTAVLMAYRSSTQAVAPQWARFDLPAAWRTQAPFRYPANDESILVVVNGQAPVRTTLRYGRATYSQRCGDPWVTSGTWGRLCILNTQAPFYSGHAVAHQDTCANSDQVWNTTNCADARRFTLGVR